MKKAAICVLIIALVTLPGCEKKTVSRKVNQIIAAYEVRMDQGKTTPEEDKRFIRAMSKNALEMDIAIRGTKKAQATRAAAIRAAELGIEPDMIPKLDGLREDESEK